jgi:catecholate siderophore receptor
MGKGLGQHGGTLLAAGILLTGGIAQAFAQESTTAAAGNVNAQAVTLEPITVVEENKGSVGYLATRTTSATKTDTPLRDVPQAVSVVTEQQIKDQGAQRLEDIARYVPGVGVHQGEGNRDQFVLRGQSSTADLFVNGMRDDAQIFRDLYNAERVEFLKGPNAMIFGRGGGGGVINRVLKEADGIAINELRLQGGSFDNKRAAMDSGGKVNDTVAARINAVYEDSGSHRDFFRLKRYGINPMMTWAPTAATKVKLSYEHFYDRRTADRGIPSQNGVPFVTAPSTFFGNPALSYTPATSNILMAVVEHEFDSALKVKSQTRFADYKKFYQNVFNATGVPVSASGIATLNAYQNTNDRQNLFNQTDWIAKLQTGPIGHTVLFGTEFGRQKSANARFTGFFSNGTTSLTVPASNPVTYDPVDFTRGLASDARNRTNLNLAAAYVQDQIEITRHLQFIGGVRFDRFDLTYTNLQSGTVFGQQLGRVDNLVSPRAGVVVKPIEPLSLYASYRVSYLPSSGDQFNSLTTVTQALQPEQFTNREIGLKYHITPVLALTLALYRLDRANTTTRDASTGLVVAAGQSRVDGVETTLTGYVTQQWQVISGYAYQNAHFLTSTSNAAGAVAAAEGARIPHVPRNSASFWNRYDFSEMWGAGLGIIHQSEIYPNADNTVKLPGWTRVDGALFFTLNKHVRGQVNVENIFGATYYPSADANNNITTGSPRAARVVLTADL